MENEQEVKYPHVTSFYCGPSVDAPGLIGDWAEPFVAVFDIALSEEDFVQIQFEVPDVYHLPTVIATAANRMQQMVEGLTGSRAMYLLK